MILDNLPKRKDYVQVFIVCVSVALGWLLLLGEVGFIELLSAGIAGLATGLAGLALRRRVNHRQIGLRLWWRYLPVIMFGAVKDSWTVTKALINLRSGNQPQGAFRRIRFDAVSDTPGDVGQRILATFGTTLQPNSYIVGYDMDKHEVLVHELVPGQSEPFVVTIRREE